MASETQKRIAAILDADAKDAAEKGYSETAEVIRQKAADYRAATGQQPDTEKK